MAALVTAEAAGPCMPVSRGSGGMAGVRYGSGLGGRCPEHGGGGGGGAAARCVGAGGVSAVGVTWPTHAPAQVSFPAGLLAVMLLACRVEYFVRRLHGLEIRAWQVHVGEYDASTTNATYNIQFSE